MADPLRAVRITGPGRFEFVEIEPPRPGPGQVLVRPLYLAICGSDIFKLHYESVDSYPRPVGTTGHEMVGVVESIGEGVGGIEAGITALVLAPDHDAMSERFVAEAEWVLPLRDNRSPVEYLMAQQLGTVIYACRRLPSLVGMSAAIVGQGSVGLFFAAFLKRLGVARIIAMDVVSDRLRLSKSFGVDEAVNNRSSDPERAVREFTAGAMADIVVEAAGEVSSINLAPNLVRPHGIVVLFGIPHEQRFEFDYWSFFRRYATTITSGGAMLEPEKRSFRLALDLIDSGAIDVGSMVSHRIPFDRVGEAYEIARTKRDGAQKVVVIMPGAHE